MSLRFGDAGETITNREEFLRRLGLDFRKLTLTTQEHGTRVVTVTEEHCGRGASDAGDALPSADGLITDVPGCPVGILVADCCCILMADKAGRVVGAFHAGWRGTLGGMAGNAVKNFQDEFSVPAGDLLAWFGPAICGRCFEVGPEVWRKFRETWGGECLLEQPYRVDLPALNRKQLIAAGMKEESVETVDICSLESETCFSHRRGDDPEGRMLGVIARRQGE